MNVKFWGCRGSLPASFKAESVNHTLKYALSKAIEEGLNSDSNLDAFIAGLPFGIRSTYGTNTPCIEIVGGEEYIICDAGSGIRDLGKYLVSKRSDKHMVINLIMSHLHWDHMQGFPFFIPAYIQGTTIRIWGCHPNIQEAFIKQQESPFFPVRFSDMGSTITFHQMDPNQEYIIGGIGIKIQEQPHPGTSYGYAFSSGEKKIVYSTDVEHDEVVNNVQNPFKAFYQDADILIIDGQFNLADHLYTKQNWGHSSNLIAIEMATISSVKTLCLFHADHLLDDIQLDKFLADSRRYLEIYAPESTMKIVLAYDGMTLKT